MANYNPSSPEVVGNEWVPIRSEPATLAFDQEVGTTFDVAADATVTTGRFYLDQVPPDQVGQVPLMSVYALGAEADTGQVRQIDVPVTGSTISGGGSISGAPNATTAIQSPADGSQIVLPAGASVDFSFGITGAGASLAGKRIIAVELVHSSTTSEPVESGGVVSIKDTSANPALGYGALELFPQRAVPRLSTVPFGEINPFLLGHPSASSARWPWTYPQLQRFDFGAASKLTLTVFSTVTETYLRYAVLRVTYCEENRVAVGGVVTSTVPYVVGGNAVELRAPGTLAAGGVVLRPGGYAVTVTVSQQGTETLTGLVPAVRQLRQLYPLPRPRGIVITRPGLDRGAAQAREADTLPQLSLHTAAAAVPGVHPYGTQLPVPVFGTQVAHQDIAVPSGGEPYRYARFYARRVGGPGGPLIVRRTTDTTQEAGITVAELDALPEIIDGWREVNLRFPSGAVPTGTGFTTWEFSAPAATAANLWQVLAARAIGGTGAAALGPATYRGDFGRLSTGLSTGPVPVPDADATLMFLREPPRVEGLFVFLSTQGLASITDDCDREPDGTLRALRFHTVVADPVTVPGGVVQVQRRDDIDPDWHDIMMTAAGGYIEFADYEARVGVTSQYRARAVTTYGIVGPWSITALSYLPEPGVFGSAQDHTVLIFTSNTRQDGSANLAYATAFERTATEDFVFTEADQVSYQRMYGRDYQVAFHGTERGGAQFSRTVVVHAAAIPAPSLPNMQSLRDLAWADLPYVCVRDELGNRWFAAITVPSGVVRNRRRLYLARVDITEVAAVPSPIDPAGG